jgi:hypothetical protein
MVQHWRPARRCEGRRDCKICNHGGRWIPPPPAEVQGVYAFEFRHGMADPLLEVVSEPRLYTICKPDGFSFEERGGRPIRGALEVLSTFLQVFTTNEHAQIAITVKLQVAVDVSEGELFPAAVFLIDDLHDLFHFHLIVRVVLTNRLQQLLCQDVVNLISFLSLEGQVQLPDDLFVFAP